MPIYEYECDKCGKVSEEFQKFSDAPLKKCRACGGKVHKLMSLNAFHLKGSGWYVTDYVRTDKKEPSSVQKPENEVKSGTENKKSASNELSETSKTSTSS